MTRPATNPYTDPTARRAFLDREARLRQLPSLERDLVRLGEMQDLNRWLEQIRATGGCAEPVYLTGHTTTLDASTGEALRHYTTGTEPGGRLAVRCRNRRASRCPSCSREHGGDTFHLVRSGLIGGKGVPNTVRTHPRLFVTLTAPSFGPVHRADTCHPARRRRCEHGGRHGCGRTHPDADPLIGQPLCADCYDYPGHILWNAMAPVLWKAFRDNLYHHVATRAGVGRSQVRTLVRVSSTKVAEYQKRGAVHFHAVIRFDGPAGPGSPPPPWATSDLLLETVHSAAAAVALPCPDSAAYSGRRLSFGTQLDAHPLTNGDGGRLTDDAVAAYVAKYTSKSAETAGAVDRRITSAAQIRALRVVPHVRALIATAWRLGELPELEHLRLRTWAHTLGYLGHCLTKTHAYSTTYTRLRADRAEHARALAGAPPLYTDWDNETTTESAWRFAGTGHTPAEALIAAGIAEDLATNREITHSHRGEISSGPVAQRRGTDGRPSSH
ncbi:replication initiator [Kitasatospora aureofaciens]|uniref:replication initiator n=1 Tax=Kitasatospora aureofaciens TaxID=1894 RepID=UPI000A5B0B0F|nr:plasmid replication initiator protein [Streptomyces viridifaciens]